jgi:hypothetical protein
MYNVRQTAVALALLASAGEIARSQSAADPPSGPFGLSEGLTLAQLRGFGALVPVKGMAAVYTAPTVPKPHRDFDHYILAVGSKVGLCKVVAIGKDIESSSFGDELRTAFATTREALGAKYGNSKLYDYLQEGSIWNEGRDWMMGLAKKERTLSAFWSADEQSTLTGHVRNIELEARSLGTSRGYLTLSYEFDNFDACKAEMDKQNNDAF